MLCRVARQDSITCQGEGGVDGAGSQEREEKGAYVQGMEGTKESPDDYHRGYEIRKQLLSSLENQSDWLLNEGHFRNPQTPVAGVQGKEAFMMQKLDH